MKKCEGQTESMIEGGLPNQILVAVTLLHFRAGSKCAPSKRSSPLTLQKLANDSVWPFTVGDDLTSPLFCISTLA